MLNGWEKLYKVLHMQINRQSHLKFTLPDTFVETTIAPPPLPALLHDSLQDGMETMTIYNTGRGRGTKDHHRYSSGRSVLTKYVAECGIIIN